MKTSRRGRRSRKQIVAAVLFMAGAVLAGCTLSRFTAATPVPAHPDEVVPKDLDGFAVIEPVDLHTHVFNADPAFFAFMDRMHLHIVDILVVDRAGPYNQALEPQRSDARAVVRASQGHAVLCTTFDPYDIEEPGFTGAAIKQLDKDFAAGALAVKIHLEMGMRIRRHDGTFVMPDDRVYEPIYRDISAHHKTLIAHLAEPDSCWQPLDPHSPDYSYYSVHPEAHMYLHPDYPRKATILAARDHILAENPNLRVIGAHLGSMEADLDGIAAHLDRYPNFAVEIGGRAPYFALQPRDKVRNFLIKYQDRVLYGTDLELGKKRNFRDVASEWEAMYTREWKFFSTDQTVDLEGHTVQGLKLPQSVLLKLYHQNAVRWIAGTGW